jgi:hypothetical protein
MRGYGTLDVITLSGYGRTGGRKMKAQQRRFKAAAKRCRGNTACMSKALGGTGYGRAKKKKYGRRRGMGLLPHSKVAGTTCINWKKVRSKVTGGMVTRCKEFGYDRFNEYASYDSLSRGKKIGKGGRSYKKGVWKSLYKQRKVNWPKGGTDGMSCKAFKAGPKSKGCPVKCVSFTKKPKGTSVSSAAAKRKCAG